MDLNPYFWDEKNTRYRLVKTNPGNVINNWLFVPGGPGGDSSYFLSLIDGLSLPGNFWLIDFPENGSNAVNNPQIDFDAWGDCLMTCIQKFEAPIYVGHSFGGMFPLSFPQLENLLKGFVILSSAPSLWHEEAEKAAAANNIPSLQGPLKEFQENPNPTTFKTALLACAPYYFMEENLADGKKLLEQMPFNYHAALWWQKKVREINFNAEWIPEKVPTLILGASHDFITPFSLFEKDTRFRRENITLKKIQQAGHFPWLEQMPSVKEAFNHFYSSISQK